MSALELAEQLVAQGRRAEAHAMLWAAGRELISAGNAREAAVLFSAVLRLAPHDADAIGLLGSLYLDLERLPAARSCFERVLALVPQHAQAMNALGLISGAEGDERAAQRWLRQAIAQQPLFPEARNNLGNAAARRGRSVEAIKHYRLAVAQRADYTDAWLNLADELAWCGDADGAEVALARCLTAQPDHALAHQRRAYLLLARGDYANGWREHSWRFAASTGQAYLRDPRAPDRLLPSPQAWGEEPLGGRRLLVLAEEGLGDELFCLRFVAALRARGAQVVYQPSPKLYPLLQGTPLLEGVVAPAAALPDFDQALAMGDLGLLAMLQGAAPIPPPFALALAAEPCAAARRRLAGAADGPYLGLTWRAGKAADGVRRKAVPLAALAAAVRAWPGSLVALQRDADADELATLAQASGRPVIDYCGEADSLRTALPLLAALDDYVGVSNTLVHMLASLGRPGRVLLPLAAEWRWQREVARSPWMPGITLHRAVATRDWRVPLAQLTRELTHVAAPRS